MHISTFSDRELLDAIRQNDERAFAELFRRYWKSVHTVVYGRIRSLDIAQEIVQNLFISIWEKRASISINHLPSYLHTAAKNRVINHIESQLIQKKHWDYYKQFIPDHDHTTEHAVEWSELMRAVENGMSRLPEKSRRIFRLHRFDGLSITEIAGSLKVSEKAIQYHITKSIKQLKLHLKDYILSVCVLLIIPF